MYLLVFIYRTSLLSRRALFVVLLTGRFHRRLQALINRIPNTVIFAVNGNYWIGWSTTITNSSDDNYTYPWFLFV